MLRFVPLQYLDSSKLCASVEYMSAPKTASKINASGTSTPIPILAPVPRPDGHLVGAFIAVVEDFRPEDDDAVGTG